MDYSQEYVVRSRSVLSNGDRTVGSLTVGFRCREAVGMTFCVRTAREFSIGTAIVVEVLTLSSGTVS